MTELSEIEEGLEPRTLDELRALPLTAGRALVAVDADDTLVHFVRHLSAWMLGRGFEMRLDSYQLEGSMFPAGSDDPLPFQDCIALINEFFARETARQEAVEGCVAALAGLARDAQVMILTNIPRHAAPARRANLDGLGLDYPMVVNSGGKGRAMAWLAARVEAPVALIDDSTNQLESVARHAPDAVRLHFAGTEHIRRLYPECAHADEQVRDWPACLAAVRRLLALE